MSSLTRIINSKLENDTIDRGIEVVDQVDSTDYENMKVKSLGLQVVLLGLAEIQALRVRNLSLSVYELEKTLFNRAKFAEMSPSQVMDLYQRASAGLTEASGYIKSTISSINWAEIEAQLALLSTRSKSTQVSGDDQLSKAAGDILNKLSAMVGNQAKS